MTILLLCTPNTFLDKEKKDTFCNIMVIKHSKMFYLKNGVFSYINITKLLKPISMYSLFQDI